MSEKNTLKPIINGVVTLLNCDTIIKKIRNKAIRSALERNAISFACSSC